MDLVGDARFVLIGEASHGTREFYRERAQITKRFGGLASAMRRPDLRARAVWMVRSAVRRGDTGDFPDRHVIILFIQYPVSRTERSERKAHHRHATAMTTSDGSERQVQIVAGDVALVGDLAIPAQARGLVMFAHGSGSSRSSPRNRFVAHVLQQAGLATLLVDLLTMREERIDQETMEWRFNIRLLAGRLAMITEWQQQHSDLRQFPLGYFGASTGSAAALIAAAERPEYVKAVVSRGGRPDLAEPFLSRVQAPTLLIVGGDDTAVLELNRQALARISAEKKLDIIPGATHLFEEPGALEDVARLARDWFQQHLL